jgi:hypothetical protein
MERALRVRSARLVPACRAVRDSRRRGRCDLATSVFTDSAGVVHARVSKQVAPMPPIGTLLPASSHLQQSSAQREALQCE